MTKDDLTGLPEPLRAELTRLRTEHKALIADREQLTARLASSERAAADSSAEATALRREIDGSRAQRDVLRSELADTRRERDALRLRLLDAELRLAGVADSVSTPGTTTTETDAAAAETEQRAMRLADQVAELTNELAATKATLSWRVTAPLRAVRRRTRR